MSAVWELNLLPTHKLVLMALADHSSDAGECYPGMEGLAEKCNISKSTIIRTIKKLESLGHISVKRRKNTKTGKQYVNQYALLFMPSVKMKPGTECQIDEKPGVIGDTITITKTLLEPSLKDKRFSPPSITELQIYMAEKTLNIDAEYFIDFYQSKGWMIGKSKMKDWKAAARNWSKRQKDEPKRQKTYEEIKANLTRGNTYEQLD